MLLGRSLKHIALLSGVTYGEDFSRKKTHIQINSIDRFKHLVLSPDIPYPDQHTRSMHDSFSYLRTVMRFVWFFVILLDNP